MLELSRVVEQIPGHLFWKDINGIFLGCNDFFAKSCGFNSIKEVIGRSDYDFPWAYTEAHLYRKDDTEIVLNGIQKLNFKETQTRMNGTLYQIIVNKTPLISSNKIIGVIGTAHDVIKTNDINLYNSQHTDLPTYIVANGQKEILYSHFKNNLILSILNQQEIECLSLWIANCTIEESARALHLSCSNIKILRDHIKQKLNFNNTVQIIELANQQNIYNLFIYFARIIFCTYQRSLLNQSSFKKLTIKNIELSEKESQCIYQLVKGKKIKGIAKVLGLSPRTVEHYLCNLKFKLGVYYNSDLIEMAIEHIYCNYSEI